MKKLWIVLVPALIAACLIAGGCTGSPVKTGVETTAPEALKPSAAGIEVASESLVLGGGCFWCIEAVMETVDGVMEATSGYAGGTTPDPGYREVCGGGTGHAEVVSVEYYPGLVSLEKLLDVFFAAHDPTSLNRQGNDTGTQYRSIILYDSEGQKAVIEEYLAGARAGYDEPLVTEVVPLERFYPAEEYHQDYYEKNPGAPYCASVISPKVKKAKELKGR